MIEESKLYIAIPIPLSGKSKTSCLTSGPPFFGVKTISNFPASLAKKSVLLYWSPKACLPITMGFFHYGTKRGTFLQIIGSLKTVPFK